MTSHLPRVGVKSSTDPILLLGRGKRLDEAVPESGLGLSIVRDIAGLYGGEGGLADTMLGGLRVTLTLPGTAARPRTDGAAA